MSDPLRPRTMKGLALAGALRKSRSMPDPEVDWSAWIAAIEDEAVALSTTPAPDHEAVAYGNGTVCCERHAARAIVSVFAAYLRSTP